MLGAIIGDTVGSVYEFNNIKTTDFPLFGIRSNYTDDSIMTMAVADWLLTDPQHGMDTLEASFLNFAKRYPCPMGGYGGGFNRWLFRPEALGDYGIRDFKKGTRHPYNSFGNGAAMRCGANGWMFDTLEETERVAGLSAAITHNHPEGIKGAQSTAAAIFMARNGKSKEEIRDYISTKYGYNLNRTCDEIRPMYDWESSCQGTVPEAMVAFFDSTDFESAIRLAVSLGGDSDTLACITGGIAEAYYKTIPDEIAVKIWDKLPEDFKAILKEMETRTSYRLPSILKSGETL
ncbi:MAG: ADP-ribosylglycohydrolase family protein [Bacteroidales bacterium]|nr:ADP-ribosylglycohydrolase family protein [Bacteroidales bacterium]